MYKNVLATYGENNFTSEDQIKIHKRSNNSSIHLTKLHWAINIYPLLNWILKKKKEDKNDTVPVLWEFKFDVQKRQKCKQHLHKGCQEKLCFCLILKEEWCMEQRGMME